MNIVVCAKQVPDTAAEKRLSSDGTLDRSNDADQILNPLDEYGTEAALKLVEANGGEVTILMVGPKSATETLRKKALPMGADKAIQVTDEALHGSDAVATAYALAQALKQVEGFDLVILGSESTDARGSLVPSALSEFTGLPGLTFAKSIEVDGNVVRIQREGDKGFETVEAEMPAIVSVVKGINEPRYPSFKGIMAAKNKPLDEKDAAGAGIDTSMVGLANSKSKVGEWKERPPKEAGTIVEDDGEAFAKLADWLEENKLL
ncbi:MAG: electron transfer flavoprotein subunit beta [Acidobacteria bacterium]|nr:MAG: electron transfer flavoprotein subunit beta [Acidobacteriota bacterium]